MRQPSDLTAASLALLQRVYQGEDVHNYPLDYQEYGNFCYLLAEGLTTYRPKFGSIEFPEFDVVLTTQIDWDAWFADLSQEAKVSNA